MMSDGYKFDFRKLKEEFSDRDSSEKFRQEYLGEWLPISIDMGGNLPKVHLAGMKGHIFYTGLKDDPMDEKISDALSLRKKNLKSLPKKIAEDERIHSRFEILDL